MWFVRGSNDNMKRWFTPVAWCVGVLLVLVAVGLLFLQGRGVSTHAEPSWVEARAALFLRSWLTPSDYKRRLNPVAVSPEALAAAREHFADHCASCHNNDGSGDTDLGRSLYPKAPDMRAARTQQLTDGELFYFIEHGVRLTGMPGWSTGTPEGETASWYLVHFIRHLPSLTADELQEMERLNPRSPADIERDREIREFLEGGRPPAADTNGHAAHGGRQ